MTLDILTSDLLQPATHGFFTRKGGVSTGPYAGLNCGLGSGDEVQHVLTNRLRVSATIGVERLESVHQTHSADVLIVDTPVKEPRPEADALVTQTPGLALTILTADCQPVLFYDPQAKVIGAAHAGWRGALDGILEATLAAMQRLGAHISRIHAVIGPTISANAYEVGPEFRDRFLADDPDTAQFFFQGDADRFQFDLPSYGLWRLRRAGVGQATWTGHCTYTDSESFYSYRRACHDGASDYGRLISAIRL